MVVQEPGPSPGTFLPRVVLPAKRWIFQVGLPGLEPGTSSLSEKHDVLLKVSRGCKVPANSHIISKAVFSRFQDIHSGCCTVAAHKARSAGLEPATCFPAIAGTGRMLLATRRAGGSCGTEPRSRRRYSPENWHHRGRGPRHLSSNLSRAAAFSHILWRDERPGYDHVHPPTL
jgi:hypothetical protein